MNTLDTGLERNRNLAANFSGCLADSIISMVKIQAYHWNALGRRFHPIHLLTEQYYVNLFEAIDVIAERIRAFGHPALSSMTGLVALTGFIKDTGNLTTVEMRHNLVDDIETAIQRFRGSIELAEDANDCAMGDLLTERNEFHDKAIWMLRAIASR